MSFLMFELIYLCIGAGAGFLSGIFGVGGGIIIVPLLLVVFHALHFPQAVLMHMAVGTSLAAIVIIASFSTTMHYRRGATIWSHYRKLGVGIVCGVIVGAILAHHLHSYILRLLFGALALLLGLRMLLSRESQGEKVSANLPVQWITSSVSVGVGMMSGMLGIGGGSFFVPLLSRWRVPMRDAVAVSSACSVTAATVGSVCFILSGQGYPNLPAHAIGFVYWPAVIGIGIMAPLFVFAGVAVSRRTPNARLKKLFAVMLIVMAIKMIG